ncbi:predicted extracellular nuclease [Hahella chejuensis KCTC 2396]|uniref:Predicted extracellular nuclease n=1 Tax=Hahella chejuensis (strain KCTC 2396) TaxID=349521 RepID=Q2S834_HAHCH|nr:ExeM/NucH family extracellular endonuclease [Hahella chejuensis]ABC33190.1 predicted extracellular nuclease [Hahella chejuensis KCTC 2396]
MTTKPRFRVSALLLGMAMLHTGAVHAAADLFFSEYVEGSSNNKALEIYNGTSADVDLSAYEVQMYFNGSSSAGVTLNLSGTLAAGDVYVIAHSSADPAILTQADLTSGGGFFNGDDAILLLKGGAAVDSIGQIGVDPGSEWGSGDVSTANNTMRRKSDVEAGDNDPYDAYDPTLQWDGYANDTFDGLGSYGDGPTDPGGEPGEIGECGDPATLISAIQGDGASSPLNGQQVVLEAVVTADLQGADEQKGFFVQEEDADQDGNDKTSEGVLVYADASVLDVSVGQKVRVLGSVTEYYDLTEVNAVQAIKVCGGDNQVTPAQVSLPLDSADALEKVEGMLVTSAQPWTVNEVYNLGRYGEVLLGNGRRYIPTHLATPGEEAAAVAAANALNQLVLDDGSTKQNPAVIPFPAPELSALNTLRVGDKVNEVTGVISYSFSVYRMYPTVTPAFVAENPRTDAPVTTGAGNLKVASFNVLNYFNGDGQGGGFPTSRGATTAEELERQAAKTVAALLAMDADVVGLMEIENDGYGADSAIQDLVNRLNAAGANYAVVNPGLSALGGDEIAVGMIYKADKVTPAGAAKSLSSYPFDNFNRQPLAQTFSLNDNDGKITVVVNHFKSKGCTNAEGDNQDQGDGQGCYNAKRSEAAVALADWLASDPTGAEDADVLIIGDLNAYAKEDPIMALQTQGYHNLLAELNGDAAYSYVFSGETGYLDHALASESLRSQVVGVSEWHINGDEPRALDYNVEFKTDAQVLSLYSPDAFRSSDHDPVIVEISLDGVKEEVKGDFDGDGDVDGRDLLMLLKQLFRSVNDDNRQYDLNEDGRISFLDVFAFLRLL